MGVRLVTYVDPYEKTEEITIKKQHKNNPDEL